MLLRVASVLTPEQVRECRETLSKASWEDGRATAGHRAVKTKRNKQLAANDPATQAVGDLILNQLAAHPLFISAALPLKVLPPRFNRYDTDDEYGYHVDGAVLPIPGTGQRVRTDISATLFFSEPDEYDGGELVIEDTYGPHRVKLPAGDLILYPGTSLHRVTPVTRGVRLASFFWIQSLIRDDARRTVLFELDSAIQQLSVRVPGDAELDRLMGVYHNLLRLWSNT